MSSLLRWATNALRRAPSPPVRFPPRLPTGWGFQEFVEEDCLDRFDTGRYYPVHIGDVFHSKYQVMGKLGYGALSTVWLAHDLVYIITRPSNPIQLNSDPASAHDYVALKVLCRTGISKEIENYDRIKKASSLRFRRPFVRSARDSFTIPRPGGDHHGLILEPMLQSLTELLLCGNERHMPAYLLKPALMQVFEALDFLHTECRLVHTDIKSDNLFVEIRNKPVLKQYADAEMHDPTPYKIVHGSPVYQSRILPVNPAGIGRLVLGDFGSAVRGDQKRNHPAQPEFYRSPEVMLEVDWSYPIDIWNVGALIWQLFENEIVFSGYEEVDSEIRYRTRNHLASNSAFLGPPPLDLLQRGKRTPECFAEDGQWKGGVEIAGDRSLEESENNLHGESKVLFLHFMRKMLQWRPEDRQTAAQLLNDPWLNSES